jgi:NRPS condensation-like uncharacterized protein
MKKPYTRKMTFNDRAFVASDMTFHFIFDGEGRLDPERWRKAVAVASEANPGTRLILKGHLGWSRWVDSGITPPVREVDGSNWDGMGTQNAPTFFLEPLPYRESPTCEIILIQGPVPRVVFRTHHGVCDARGALFWVEDVFRALRGETVVGSTSNMTDVEMCRSFQDQYRTPFPTEHIAPTGSARGNESGMIWKRCSLKGKIPHLLSRCVRLAAEEAWRHGEGVVRFGIPVDLRRHKPELSSTGNLSFALYIEVKKDTTPDEIERDIALQISRGDEGRLTKGDELLEHIPLCLIRRMAARIIRKRHDRGIYSLSGILSNLGRVDLNRFHGGGFAAKNFWGIAPNSEYYPFFLVMMGYEGGTELILSVPRVLAGEGRLEDAMARMVQGLEKKE